MTMRIVDEEGWRNCKRIERTGKLPMWVQETFTGWAAYRELPQPVETREFPTYEAALRWVEGQS